MPVAILSSLAVTIKNVCKHWQLSPEVEEAKLALTENHCFRGGIPLPPSPSWLSAAAVLTPPCSLHMLLFHSFHTTCPYLVPCHSYLPHWTQVFYPEAFPNDPTHPVFLFFLWFQHVCLQNVSKLLLQYSCLFWWRVPSVRLQSHWRDEETVFCFYNHRIFLNRRF